MEERSVAATASSGNDFVEPSASSSRANAGPVARPTCICLVGDVLDIPNLEAAQKFGIPIVASETGLEFLNDATRSTVFVLKQFCGPVYDALYQDNQRIVGPTALRLSSAMDLYAASQHRGHIKDPNQEGHQPQHQD